MKTSKFFWSTKKYTLDAYNASPREHANESFCI